MTANRKAPGAEGNSTRGNGSQTIETYAQGTATTWQDVCETIRGTFVVVVDTGNGRHRRRCYLTINAAQAAADRARDRGQAAVVVLSKLHPVAVIEGADE